MAKVTTMEELFLDEIRDLYDAEKQLTKALPKMAKAAEADDLRDAFEAHLEQTRGHVDRLHEIFELVDEPARSKKCKGMEGLIAEGKEVIEEALPDAVGDAALIGAAQRVEHYEIAAYGTAKAHAQLLGQGDAVNLLDQTLEEERETDEKLTDLASRLNPEAATGGGSADDENGEMEREAVGAGSKSGRGGNGASAGGTRHKAGTRR